MTLAQKVVLPIFLFGASAFFAVLALVRGRPGMFLYGAALLLVVVLVAKTFLLPLKFVTAHADALDVSNYRRHVRVLYENIREVHRVGFGTLEIVLREPSEFGRDILFIPRAAVYVPFVGEHPVYRFLQERMRGAQ